MAPHLAADVGKQFRRDVNDVLLRPPSSAVGVRQRDEVGTGLGILVRVQGQHPSLGTPAEHLGVCWVISGVLMMKLEGYECE